MFFYHAYLPLPLGYTVGTTVRGHVNCICNVARFYFLLHLPAHPAGIILYKLCEESVTVFLGELVNLNIYHLPEPLPIDSAHMS